MEKRSHTFQLLQLADSAFPTGGFAYSFGLEASAHLGQIPTYEAFLHYLDAYLRNLSHSELAFLNSSYEVKLYESDPLLGEILSEWHAFLTTPEIRKGNRVLGENWFHLIQNTFSPPGIQALESAIGDAKQPKYFTVVFPLLLKALGYDIHTIRDLYFHISLREQINAAIRLGLIGTRLAQKIHHQFSLRCDELIKEYQDLHYTEAFKSEPLIELALASHGTIYSRLFQN